MAGSPGRRKSGTGIQTDTQVIRATQCLSGGKEGQRIRGRSQEMEARHQAGTCAKELDGQEQGAQRQMGMGPGWGTLIQSWGLDLSCEPTTRALCTVEMGCGLEPGGRHSNLCRAGSQCCVLREVLYPPHLPIYKVRACHGMPNRCPPLSHREERRGGPAQGAWTAGAGLDPLCPGSACDLSMQLLQTRCPVDVLHPAHTRALVFLG